ncbi:MAG: 4-alpha-glucanotransferase [Acetobacteraceae bacterium]
MSEAMLDELARGAGIAPEWHDLEGGWHIVSVETKRALLAAIGLPAERRSDAEDSLARLAARTWRGLPAASLPAAKVVREGSPVVLPIAHFGECGGGPVAIALQLEEGGVEHLLVEGEQAMLPPLPIGRHVVAREDQLGFRSLLTVAPRRCYLPAELAGGARYFGVAAHLATLSRHGDQGIGDFTTLAKLAEKAGENGAAAIGINPLHALFPADRQRASPYYPSDRRFLDPIYIDVTALPPFGEADAVGALLNDMSGEVTALSVAPLVDYRRVWALKRMVLEAAFVAFEALGPNASPKRAFTEFVAAKGGPLRHFATFEAIAEKLCEPWPGWPSGYAHPFAPGVARFAEAEAQRIRFHQFLQFLAEAQLASAAERARASGLALGLYRDLAVGAAPDGAEVWANQESLASGVSVGAPPDRFAPGGQIWHLPPPDPLSPDAQSLFAQVVAANMRHAGALRIDHVMGLQRLFWIPGGAEARDGAYVNYPFDDLLGHLALESVRARTLVVGEDLGTLPDGFRARLADEAVLSCRVLWFERDDGRFRAPGAYPRMAVAAVSTHDLPTLIGWWLGLDWQERRELGISSGDEAAARLAEKQALLEALAREGLLGGPVDLDAEPTPELLAGVHAYLARTPAILALVQADDLAGAARALNLPGTDRERPNWRRRLELSVERLLRSERARIILAALVRERGAQTLPSTVSAT